MNVIPVELRRKNCSGLLVAALLLFNGLGLALVLTAGRYPISLYVRNALFSEVVDDQQVPSEAALNLCSPALNWSGLMVL